VALDPHSAPPGLPAPGIHPPASCQVPCWAVPQPANDTSRLRPRESSQLSKTCRAAHGRKVSEGAAQAPRRSAYFCPDVRFDELSWATAIATDGVHGAATPIDNSRTNGTNVDFAGAVGAAVAPTVWQRRGREFLYSHGLRKRLSSQRV